METNCSKTNSGREIQEESIDCSKNYFFKVYPLVTLAANTIDATGSSVRPFIANQRLDLCLIDEY